MVDAHGEGFADGHADSNPQEQEQEQEKAEEQSARNRSAAPQEKRIGKVGTGQDPQARAREGEATSQNMDKSQGTGTSQTTATSLTTATSQPIAEEPIEPTGADPMAAASQGGREPVIECVDVAMPADSDRTPARTAFDPLVLAVYDRLYPTAQFESTESLKARDGRGLSMRQFRATEQGEISSVINAAMAGATAAQRSALCAWCISAAEEVYRRDHRKKRYKPIGSVWTWRLNRHRNGVDRGLPGALGPP
jgi:DNA polymerase III gamma/tau subunit